MIRLRIMEWTKEVSLSRACSFVEGLYLCVFFFSSRRRHTRCSRDWSSDVCSSDLKLTAGSGYRPGSHRPSSVHYGVDSRRYQHLQQNSCRLAERTPVLLAHGVLP